MEKKQNDVFTIAIIAAILLLFSAVDVLSHAGFLKLADGAAETEKPKAAMSTLLYGSFFDNYEAYEKGRFYNQKKWKDLIRKAELILGKREYDNVLLGKQNTLFARSLAEQYEGAPVEKSLAYLENLVNRYGARVMLIPTASGIWRDKLPFYEDVFAQKPYLEEVRKRIGERAFVDVWKWLEEHRNEEIYYKTDSHWTSLGAGYGYLAWWELSGKRLRYEYDPKKKEVITDSFLGPLAKKSGLSSDKEEIFVFSETLRTKAQVTYLGKTEETGLYRPEYLDTDHAYDYFLGDDFGFAQIDVESRLGSTLFIIGDSYANCMIPMLTAHYKTIYFLNPSRYQGNVDKIIDACASRQGMDVLVLQSVTGFLDGFR